MAFDTEANNALPINTLTPMVSFASATATEVICAMCQLVRLLTRDGAAIFSCQGITQTP
jgi:hypothetical protein